MVVSVRVLVLQWIGELFMVWFADTESRLKYDPTSTWPKSDLTAQQMNESNVSRLHLFQAVLGRLYESTYHASWSLKSDVLMSSRKDLGGCLGKLTCDKRRIPSITQQWPHIFHVISATSLLCAPWTQKTLRHLPWMLSSSETTKHGNEHSRASMHTPHVIKPMLTGTDKSDLLSVSSMNNQNHPEGTD